MTLIHNILTVTHLESILLVPIGSGEKRRIVNRYACGIVFSPVGESRYLFDGETYILDSDHALLLPEGADYTIECVTGDICPLLNFSCNRAVPKPERYALTGYETFAPRIEALAKNGSLSEGERYYAGMALLYEIFARLAADNAEQAAKYSPLVDAARRIFELRCGDLTLSNDMVARELNVSTVYFRKRFTSETGVSPMRYLLDLRIRRAKLLLREQILSMEEIAETVGFASLYSFSRAFRRETGYSPSRYGELCRIDVRFCEKGE